MRLKDCKLIKNIISKKRIIFEKKYLTEVLNYILQNSLSYYKFKINGENAEFVVSLFGYKRFINMLKTLDIEYAEGNIAGIIPQAKVIFNRLGLIIGAFMLIIISYFSTKFIWQIEIKGDSCYSKEELIEIFNDSGLYLGKFVPNINYDELHNKILINAKELSWISVNIKGTVATVEIKAVEKDNTLEDLTINNVVAKSDAQIISINVTNGQAYVKPGDVVKNGDVLISGIIDSKAQGVRYVDAKGEVFAYVNKKVVVSIPKTKKVKITTKKVHTERKLKIFSNIINFSLKHSKCDKFCDKIEEKNDFVILNKYKLPFSIITIEHFCTEEKEISYSDEEMTELAFDELQKQLNLVNEKAEIISKSIDTSFDDEIFTVICDIYCIEDISKEVEIFIKR